MNLDLDGHIVVDQSMCLHFEPNDRLVGHLGGFRVTDG